ncbi:MAG: hypothetical protein FWC16_02750 [Defluviitaleaceae bacterium]|nr:hypothetical protein [Defluviitaleaceae bacterium]MCL2273819.1 hypothetical protein [Defluviitaleaceae bacterium]
MFPIKDKVKSRLKPLFIIIFFMFIVFTVYRIYAPRTITLDAAATRYGEYFETAEITLEITQRRSITLAIRLYGRIFFNGEEYISAYDIRNTGDILVSGQLPPNTFLPAHYTTRLEDAVLFAHNARQIQITPGGSRLFPRFSVFTITVDGERVYHAYHAYSY